jgi:SAM-dependent methyltransferase
MIPVPPRHVGPELLDDPATVAAAPDEVAASFAEIRRLNRIAGGTSAVLRALRPLLPVTEASLDISPAGTQSRTSETHVQEVSPADAPLPTPGAHVLGTGAADTPIPATETRILDVGTGTADTPLALLHWAARHDRRAAVTGLDVSPTLLAEARRLVGTAPVTLVQGDARALPFPDAACDVAICLGVLHHFDEPEAVVVLREMWRVSRVGIVVVDLRRGYGMYALAWLALHLLSRNRFTRHDGLLSVLRAYTPPELTRLAHTAALPAPRVQRTLPGLQVLTARHIPIRPP